MKRIEIDSHKISASNEASLSRPSGVNVADGALLQQRIKD